MSFQSPVGLPCVVRATTINHSLLLEIYEQGVTFQAIGLAALKDHEATNAGEEITVTVQAIGLAALKVLEPESLRGNSAVTFQAIGLAALKAC